MKLNLKAYSERKKKSRPGVHAKSKTSKCKSSKKMNMGGTVNTANTYFGKR